MDTGTEFRFLDIGALHDRELALHLLECRPGDPANDRAPAYYFQMRARGRPAGQIDLRIGESPMLLLYGGQVGYTVFPTFRGHHYAERACRLLLPLARAHGLHTLWITCNPDNLASRRTCERLGMTLVEIVPLPPELEVYRTGARQKCRFALDLTEE